MNLHDISQGAWLDVATSVILLACIIAVAVALEISAPVVAGIGAAGAAFTGVSRVFYSRMGKPGK